MDVIHAQNSNFFETEQECMIIGLFDKPEKFSGPLQVLDQMFKGELTNLVKRGDLSAKFKNVCTVHSLGLSPIKRFIFIGVGKEKNLTADRLRSAIGIACKTMKEMRIRSFSVALDSFTYDSLSGTAAAQIFGEAFTMATYEFQGYKQKSNEPDITIEKVNVFTSEPQKEIENSLKTGMIYGKATNSARTLVNMPSNLLTPAYLAEYAADLAKRFRFELEILEKTEMEKLGMGAMLAVNQGSEEPPYMIVLKYQGQEQWTNVMGLVGKGITFDTGGYSLKSKTGIVEMKTDMAGAAAVLGAMEIIGELGPNRNVVAVIPATDNVVSAKAFKPDDVITSLNGKTIEILNTDAEGRLVLADAITYAKMHGAESIVDVATLTGGVVIALGLDKTGAITNDDAFYEKVLEASRKTGEFIWRLPLTEKDKERVRSSKVADLNNSPGREGHAIMGGAFLAEFTEDTPWVHLDIAGTATAKKNHELGPSGATGIMVRTLAALVCDHT